MFPHLNPSAEERRDDPAGAVKPQREKLGIPFPERVWWQEHSCCGNDTLRISKSIWLTDWCSQMYVMAAWWWGFPGECILLRCFLYCTSKLKIGWGKLLWGCFHDKWNVGGLKFPSLYTSQRCQRSPILKVLFAQPKSVKCFHSIDCVFQVTVL